MGPQPVAMGLQRERRQRGAGRRLRSCPEAMWLGAGSTLQAGWIEGRARGQVPVLGVHLPGEVPEPPAEITAPTSGVS